MKKGESPNKHSNEQKEPDLVSVLRELPERFFELMSSGSQLAKQGEFMQAAGQFGAARVEGSRILQRLLELPKSSHARTWQIFAVLWAFKLVKSVFYWILSQSEASETSKERKQLLLAAAGAQYVGRDLITAFKNLDKTFTGADRDLLPLLDEAIRNFQTRQRFLEKELEEEDIDLKLLLDDYL